MRKIRQFAADEKGQTLVEYGLLVALMGLALLVVFTLMARKFDAVLNLAQDGPGIITGANVPSR
jgi:Flp pilus assembly pilin Flp